MRNSSAWSEGCIVLVPRPYDISFKLQVLCVNRAMFSFCSGRSGRRSATAHEGSGLSSRRPRMDYFKDGHLLKLLYVA